MGQRTQANRQLQISTPLGPDALLLVGLSMTEELGRAGVMDLELRSEDPNLSFDDLVGQSVTVRMETAGESPRFFNGFISRFVQTAQMGRVTEYSATVVPWLWFLTQTNDCRIFQEMTVPDIIKDVFSDHSNVSFEDRLTASYRTWDYCVQYRESDFDFVSRLMEQEGIYYFVEHADGHHTVVLADGPTAHEPIEGHETIPFRARDNAFADLEHIFEWTIDKRIRPGTFVHTDYDFKAPRKDLETRSSRPRQHVASEHEVFDYPGEFTEFNQGEHYARVRLEALQQNHEVIAGVSTVRQMHLGRTFTLVEHPRDDQQREYLVVRARHTARSDTFDSAGDQEMDVRYECEFEVIPLTQTFRPEARTPRPSVRGPQTAVVTGKSGEEIWTDEHGRVKCQFHWDRYGTNDEQSSCWIRVSQLWAGSQWGAMFIPRIGQEVIVEFMEGDPDRPIIIGRVYNGDHMPPYALPENKTVSTIMSRSSKDGGVNNFNEIKLEDKKGQELFYLQAEKDRQVLVKHCNTENIWVNETISVGKDRKKTVAKNETTDVGENRTETVGLDETITIGANRSERVGVNEDITIGANRTLTVAANESRTVAVNQSEVVGVAKALTVGAAMQVTVGGALNQTVGAAMAEEVGGFHVEAIGGYKTTTVGEKMSVEAGDEIELKTGSASLTMKSSGEIKLEGIDITIQSGAGKVHIDAGGIISIKGPMVKLNT